MENDEEKKLKQKYLREQIVLSDLSQQDFIEFIGQQRHNGTDIDSWNYEELIQIVEEFKTLQQFSRRRKKAPSKLEAQIPTNPQQQPPRDDQHHLNTLLLRRFDPEKEQLDVFYQKQDPQKKGHFVLRVVPGDRLISRSVRDFQWLRDSLRGEFPFFYIPPIEGKDNKWNFVQNFLDRVLDRKIARQSRIMQIFISDELFAKKKSEGGEIAQQGYQRMLKFFDGGSDQLKIVKTLKTYKKVVATFFPKIGGGENQEKVLAEVFGSLETNFYQNQRYFSRLKHLCYDLSDSFSQSAFILKKLTNLYKQFLQQRQQDFGKIGFAANDSVDAQHQSFYLGLNEWQNQQIAMKQFVVDNLAGFFHYKKHEYKVFYQQQKALAQLVERTQREVKELLNSKEKLFAQKNVEKWNVDFNKLTIKFAELMKDRELAFKYILPEKTRKMESEHQLNVFLRFHHLYEFVSFYLRSGEYIDKNC